jgi:hypothetical protein
VVDSIGSSVPDTSKVKNNSGWSKYGHTYRCTMHYGSATGHIIIIGAEATVLINCYQCLEKADDDIEFANVCTGIGGGLENTMSCPWKLLIWIRRISTKNMVP